jgi:cytidylate kinase
VSLSKELIVDRQIKEWLTRRKVNRTPKPKKIEKRVITVTGEYGANGNQIGEIVASALGYTLYDRQIVHQVAERAQVDDALVERFERSEHTFLQEIFDELMNNRRLEDTVYARRLTEVIALVGSRGDAVILGRAANVLLGPTRALRVRCVAPLALRTVRIAQRLGLTRAEAEKETEREDARRVQWVRDMVGQDPRETSNYDLVLSTEMLSVEKAAKVVVTAFEP